MGPGVEGGGGERAMDMSLTTTAGDPSVRTSLLWVPVLEGRRAAGDGVTRESTFTHRYLRRLAYALEPINSWRKKIKMLQRAGKLLAVLRPSPPERRC